MLRRPIKLYALHKAYLGLSCRERFRIHRYQKFIRILFGALLSEEIYGDSDSISELEDGLEVVSLMYYRLTRERVVHRIRMERLSRIFQSFCEYELNNLFRFRVGRLSSVKDIIFKKDKNDK
jgi:hypothetical protein